MDFKDLYVDLKQCDHGQPFCPYQIDDDIDLCVECLKICIKEIRNEIKKIKNERSLLDG